MIILKNKQEEKCNNRKTRDIKMPLFYQTEEVTSHQACQVFSHCWPGWAGWLQR